MVVIDWKWWSPSTGNPGRHGPERATQQQCDLNKLRVTVSEVKIDAKQSATVAWSDTLNGSKRAVGSAVSLPAALKVANTNLIWGEVSYSYKPMIGYVITGTIDMADQIFMRPRLSDCVHPQLRFVAGLLNFQSNWTPRSGAGVRQCVPSAIEQTVMKGNGRRLKPRRRV